MSLRRDAAFTKNGGNSQISSKFAAAVRSSTVRETDQVVTQSVITQECAYLGAMSCDYEEPVSVAAICFRTGVHPLHD